MVFIDTHTPKQLLSSPPPPHPLPISARQETETPSADQNFPVLGGGGGLRGKRLSLRRLCRRMVGREEKEKERKGLQRRKQRREGRTSRRRGVGRGAEKGTRATKARKVSRTGGLPASYSLNLRSPGRRWGPRGR